MNKDWTSLRSTVSSLLLSGKRPFEIKSAVPDVSGAFIAGVRKRTGMPPFKRGRHAHDIFTAKAAKERDRKIIALRATSTLSYTEIGRIFKISKQHVEQVLFPHKTRSRLITQYAIKKGQLVRPNMCSSCERVIKVEAHHEDYSQPLVVKWLCKRCHVNAHMS